jgi:hypothetical protein
MVAEMGVMEHQVVLVTLCFRTSQPTGTWQDTTYSGPDINSLPL